MDIIEEPIVALPAQGLISIGFNVDRILDIQPMAGDLNSFLLSERAIDVPYIKDYDAIAGQGPAHWASQFDVSNWGLIAARIEGRRVGGAVIALRTPGLNMLEGRDDLAVLWDIRVAPEFRGRGVGSALFGAAEKWAAARGCRQLMVETQNINVPACRFYAKQGCVLKRINRLAYREIPDEVQMLWYKDLTG